MTEYAGKDWIMKKLNQTIQDIFKTTSIEPDLCVNVYKSQIRNDKTIEDYINFSSIFSILIQETGRFAEHYAADLITGIDSFRKNATELLNQNPQSHVIFHSYFGIRQNGVDTESFLNERLTEAAQNNDYFKFNNLYRRIYAIRMTVIPNNGYYTVIVYLLNITNDCHLKLFQKKEEDLPDVSCPCQ